MRKHAVVIISLLCAVLAGCEGQAGSVTEQALTAQGAAQEAMNKAESAKEAVESMAAYGQGLYESYASGDEGDFSTFDAYFAKLDKLCAPSTILATNTSAISVTDIAEKSVHKERIIGTHFWNPAYVMPLVEVVKTKYVCDDVVNQTYELLQDAGKMPVIVQKDVPGFLANRMQHALFREALSIIENDIASPEDVDKAIKYGFGMRLGVMAPIEVMDSGGIDLTYNIHEYLFPDIENSTKPSKLLKERLEEGKLGFKTGEGIMKWTPEQIEESQKNLVEGLIRVEKALNRI